MEGWLVANVGDLERVDSFRRSPVRVIGELVLPPVGGIGFLGFAVVLLGQVSTMPEALMFAGMAGFFGVLLLSGLPAMLRRGLGTTLLEIGPGGIWHRDVGRLAWAELEEVRLERNIGAGGSNGPALATYVRLGIVPRDRARIAHLSGGLSRKLAGAFIRFANSLARSRGSRNGMTDIEQTAPLGVYAYELDGSFDTLVESIRRFMPVGERVDRDASAQASPIPADPVGGTPPTESLVGIDQMLATSAVPAEEAGGVAVAERPLMDLVRQSTRPQVAEPPSPGATFYRPAIKPLDVVLGVLSVLALLPGLALLVPFVQRPGLGGAVWVLIVVILLIAVGVPWFRRVFGMLWRLRGRSRDAERLRVGPEGVWLPGMDTRPWGSIRQIRAERAGSVRRMGSPSVERWQLVVVPRSSAGKRPEFRVASDELDARFDDVLDLIRRYHPVVDTA